MDVLAAAQSKVQHAGRHRAVGDPVDEDEAAEVAVLGIGIKGDGGVEGEVADPDLVELQPLGGQVLHGVDVDLVLGLGDRGADGAGADLQQVGTAGQHGLVVHPDHGGLELVGDGRRAAGDRDDVAAADVDLGGEGERHRLAGDGLIEIAVEGDDALDCALAARGQGLDPVARLDDAGGDQAREAAEVQVGAVDPLDRHAEGAALQVVLDRQGLQQGHQRRAVVPGGGVRVLGDVVALERRHRDGGEVGDADLGGEVAVFGQDGVVGVLAPVHEVHLVDGQDHVADAEQAHEIGVPAGLGEHPAAGVDQDHRGVGGRGAGDHVAGVLLVARGVGDDELALVGGKEPVGHIDRDALLALGGQAIHQQGEVDVAPLRADPLGVGLQGGHLVVQDHLGIIEQSPDQGRLAVVHRAAGDEAQQALVLVGLEVGVDVLGDEVRLMGPGLAGNLGGHQKYPSCFFFSIEAAWSWSMARPWRSDVVVSSISWMMAGRVAAVLSTAPVSG